MEGARLRMENISYRDQVIWGTSLSMAKEDEIGACYNFIKEYIISRKDLYLHCEKAIIEKRKWICGESLNSAPLCDTARSINKEELISEIELMVSDEITVDGEKILDDFKKRRFVDVYKCGKVFFLK